jgi:hypothetical protein
VCGIVLFRTVIVLFVAIKVVLVVDTYCISIVSLHLFISVPVWMCGLP